MRAGASIAAAWVPPRPRGPRPTVTKVSGARTLWEEGHDRAARSWPSARARARRCRGRGRDRGRLGLFFDLCFVLVCLAAALLVRPRDFFTVGVLPPLLMLGTIVLVGAQRPEAIAHAARRLVQAVVTGLAHHSRRALRRVRRVPG